MLQPIGSRPSRRATSKASSKSTLHRSKMDSSTILEMWVSHVLRLLWNSCTDTHATCFRLVVSPISQRMEPTTWLVCNSSCPYFLPGYDLFVRHRRRIWTRLWHLRLVSCRRFDLHAGEWRAHCYWQAPRWMAQPIGMWHYSSVSSQ